MISSDLIDIFCDWFEGEFDNWKQASTNPSKWSHIFISHKRIANRKFLTNSRYNFSKEPYRQQEVEITFNHGQIIVLNPICNIFFNYNGHHFIGESQGGCEYKGKPFQSHVRLFENQYHSWDKGYWESADGFFLFDKRL